MKTIITVIEKNIKSFHKSNFIFVKNELENITKSYLDVIQQAKEIASYLVDNYEVQSRILLLYPQGLDFISSFLACLYAGMVAVPAYPIANRRQTERLKNIVDSCEPVLALGSDDAISNLIQVKEFSKLDSMSLNSIRQQCPAPSYNITVKITGDMLAFLQFTSGSTGSPKGVMVSHNNLMHNLKTLSEGWGLGADKVSALWLPFQHDLGLIGGVLASLYNKNTLILLSPVTVIRDPYIWLKTLSDYKAYFTAGPNFSYQLCISKILDEQLETLDLSCVGYALSAAEPNHYKTMFDFCEKFSKCGFKQEAFCVGYGLAESTLHVATNKPGKNSSYLSLSKSELLNNKIREFKNTQDLKILMSAGTLHQEHKVKIVDPTTFKKLANNLVGEIFVSSKSVAQGYWKSEAETKNIFNLKLKNDSNLYMRTGDLGFIRDSELYMTGRLKDLIIIDGQNIYPQDLENCVDESNSYIKPGCTAAFSIDNNLKESIVICCEIKRVFIKKDLNEVALNIRKKIAEKFNVSIFDIKLLKPNRAYKTTSGKIMRNATKNSYLDNSLVCIDLKKIKKKSDEQSDLYISISEIYHKVLKLDTVNPLHGFTQLGGTSIDALELYKKLSAKFNKKFSISQTIAYDYPCLSELANYFKGLSELPIIKEEVVTHHTKYEKVAVVGVGCRLPGGINSLDELWQFLASDHDAIENIPSWRWNISNYDDDLKKIIIKAGYIDDIDKFDSEFFNISPKEAKLMDPRHRLLLETVWHALEDASIPPNKIKNRKVSVFIGASGNDYKNLIAKLNNDENISSFFVLDTAASVLAGRIAYFLGLKGSAETIDSACSSSLVAIDEACQSLYLKNSELSIVGGVNVLLYPENSIGLAKAGMLSETHKCHTFSDDADGYVRAEGCGVIILKRLSDAIKDGNKIYAVIRSSSVNQDGASSGLTVPNRVAQKELIQDALNKANLQANDIDYIEAHGSATQLGDPIEIGALNDIFAFNDRNIPLYIGSIKSNIGHLEAAAGMAGILKTIACLQHKKISPNKNFKKINPKLDISEKNLKIVTKEIDWYLSKNNKPFRAGVSSFGFSGTNAHVILEEYLSSVQTNENKSLNLKLFILSANSKKALIEIINKFKKIFDDKDSIDLDSMCYLLSTGREHFSYRIAIKFSKIDSLISDLNNIPITKVINNNIIIKSKNIDDVYSSFLNGDDINWQYFYSEKSYENIKLSLPGYCFERNSLWIDLNAKRIDEGNVEVGFHPLLHSKIEIANDDLKVYQSLIDKHFPVFIKDHKLFNVITLSGSSYISSALSILYSDYNTKLLSLESINFVEPFVIRNKEYLLQTILQNNIISSLSKTSGSDESWIENCNIKISEKSSFFLNVNFFKLKQKSIFDESFTSQRHQKFCEDIGLILGPNNLWLNQYFKHKSGSLIKMKGLNLGGKPFVNFNSGFLDAVFQSFAALEMMSDNFPILHIPKSIEQLSLSRDLIDVGWIYTSVTSQIKSKDVKLNIILFDINGMQVGEIVGLLLAAVDKDVILKKIKKATISKIPTYINSYNEVEINFNSNYFKGQRWLICNMHEELIFNRVEIILQEKGAEVKTICIDNIDETIKFDIYNGIIFIGLSKLSKSVIESHNSLSHKLLLLTKAIINKSINLYLISLDALPENGVMSEVGLINSCISAFLKTILMESSKLNARQIDFPLLSADHSDLLVNLISANHKETQLSFRCGTYYNLRIIENNHFNDELSLVKGHYLITGGLGTLGLATCEWLIDKGVTKITLVGRRKVDINKTNIITKLNRANCEINYVSCDISDDNDVEKLMSNFDGLSGIYHCAGVIDDHLIANLTINQMTRVFQSKVNGTWFLVKHCKKFKIDKFVLYSSITSLIGNSGQLNYCIANSFMDDIAYYLQSINIPAISIHWGPWSKSKMISNLKSSDVVAHTSQNYLSVLNNVLDSNVKNISVIDVNWNSLLEKGLLKLSSLMDLTSKKTSGKGCWASQSLLLEENEMIVYLRDKLQNLIKDELEMSQSKIIEDNILFFDLGMTSMMALDIRQKIQEQMGSKYPVDATIMFEHSTFISLFNYLYGLLKNLN